MQLIVLGMHRSGTSCVARLLNMMGAYFAPEGMIMSPQEDNPKGFWERKDVVELNDEILHSAGGTWEQVADLDFNQFPDEERQNISRKVHQILIGLDAHRPWCLKDPRMCITFPFWHDLLEFPVVLLVYRNPIQVARSLKNRNSIPIHVGIALWEYYTVSALNTSQGITRIIIRYEDLLNSPYEVVDNLHDYLTKEGSVALRCPVEKEVTSFVTKDLCHARHDANEYGELLNQAQIALVDFFENNAIIGETDTVGISQNSLDILKASSAYRHNLSELTDNLEESKVNLGKAQEALNNARIELAEEQEENTRARQQLSDSERDHNVLESDLSEARSALAAVETDRTSLQEEFGRESEKVSQYDSWMREIKRDTQDTFSSFRWKVGDKIASMAEILLLRFNKKTTRDHIAQILGEYEAFIASGGHPVQVVGSKQDTSENINKWGTFCQLTLTALKNPAQTARLLDADRLKNLYITLFKQSPHVRENIFDYYLKLYGKNTKDSVHAALVNINQKISEITANQSAELLLVKNPQVSIIIPVYNQWEYTEKCIRSILYSAKGLAYEIILADDHSTDKTINAADIFPGIRVVKTQENSGFLLNCNNAAIHARGDYLVFLNNDTVVHENWLHAMLEIMETRPEAGMTGSKLIYPDGKLQEAGGIIWDDASGWNYGRLDDPARPEYNYVKEVDYISGASIMIRRSLWEDIGGFDERYLPAYYEDSDLAFAVREKGFKVVFTPFSVVTHFEGRSHGTDESSGIKKHQAINNVKFMEKWKIILEQEYFPNAENMFHARQKSRHKKTMLVVDHYVPFYDQDAGSKSLYQYLKWFVDEGVNVKFIGDNFYQHEPYTSALQKLGIEVLAGPWYAENWEKWLKENGSFIDYAYLHRPHIAPKYIEAIRKHTNAKIIYFGVDLHYLRLRRQYEIEKDKKLLEMADDWRRKEFAIFEQVDVVYYPSFVETEEITRHYPTKCIKAIPLNIYENISVREPDWFNREGLMFVGGFGHPPNLDAVLWFANDIFPFILEKDSSVKLTVVGSNVPEDVQQLVSDNIVVAGRVSDEELKQIYNNSLVSVVPLRYGAGIKGKVLEALYSQVPVVTTEIGAEGLPGTRQYLRLANEPESFAAQVMQLLTNEGVWVEQVKQGVDCLNTHFSCTTAKAVWGEDVSFSN